MLITCPSGSFVIYRPTAVRHVADPGSIHVASFTSEPISLGGPHRLIRFPFFRKMSRSSAYY